jgi:hypothetical protein
MPVPFEGGCRCGAVRYRCTSEPAAVVHCFCRDCQYASGGVGAPVLVVEAEKVSIEGTPAVFDSATDSGNIATRSFCSRCGSPLFARSSASGGVLMGIKVASLDDPTWAVPNVQVWTASAPPWAGVRDDLVKFPRDFGSA